MSGMFKLWPLLITGALMGMVFAPAAGWVWFETLTRYDTAFPVVRIKGERVGGNAEAVLIRMVGEKLRDCNYLRTTAYTVHDDGLMRDAYINREQWLENGQSYPPGKFDFGTWRVWPTAGAHQVVVYVAHQCGDRIVRTRVAEVKL